MTLHADLFFSFRSPYSYLAIGRYRAMGKWRKEQKGLEKRV